MVLKVSALTPYIKTPLSCMNRFISPLQKRNKRSILALALSSSISLAALQAAPATVYTENFDTFTGAATALEDTATANPPGPGLIVVDDAPAGGTAGSGVQLVNWLAKSGTQSLLVRAGSEAQVQIQQPRSGGTYQLDFNLYTVKGSGDRNFYVIVRAMGSDTNGEDFMAYRSDRAVGNGIFYYDGIETGGWTRVPADHAEAQWQHHRFIFNLRTQTFDLYIDDMTTPVVTGGDLSRSGAAVPTSIRLLNEGNSADDGYFAIDDITLTVEESRDLATTFTEGFESYTAAAPGAADDADPAGSWITTEADGTGDAKPINPVKVQVVDTATVAARSGQKSLKLEGGQRAGVSFAWGTATNSDVEISWWARVPASVDGSQATYLRMSLYGIEDGRSDGGDAALLGYGSRDANVGDETSLTIFTTAWQDTLADYVPDTWEQYRMTTHTEQGTYSIVKNPDSENPVVIADRAPFIGSAAKYGPMFMVGWSSSNGAGHPAVYIDDIQIKSLNSSVDPLPDPYDVILAGTRFKSVSSLKVSGPVGDVAVDPRDNSTIFFTIDAANGAIYQANKVSAGTWEVQAQPIVSGIDRPSGLVVDSAGTLWWTHDFTMALMRLKAPYASNTPETIISNFGSAATDDDPIDVTVAPANFTGAANWIAVADRGSDGDANNTIYLVDPATTTVNQTTYEYFLVGPDNFTIGTQNLNAIASSPVTGELVVLNADGFIYLVNGAKEVRSILPNIYADPFVTISPRALGVDPTTGRIWLADDVMKEIWSIPASATDTTAEKLEVDFTLKEGSRPDSNITFHDPGVTFAGNGSILVVSDTSTGNGGGRLHIFHSEEAVTEIRITRSAKTAQGFELEWEAAAGATYKVQRATELGVAGGFQDISAVLTEPRFTDANAPAGNAFYRVVVLR